MEPQWEEFDEICWSEQLGLECSEPNHASSWNCTLKTIKFYISGIELTAGICRQQACTLATASPSSLYMLGACTPCPPWACLHAVNQILHLPFGPLMRGPEPCNAAYTPVMYPLPLTLGGNWVVYLTVLYYHPYLVCYGANVDIDHT